MEWRHTRWDSASLVYTAIAKVANTSVKSALLQTFEPEVSRQNPHAADVPYRTVKPNRIAAEAPDYLHFAVVRNPFDRFVSFWADKIMGDGMNDGLRALGFDRGMPFTDAVQLATEIPDEETDPHIRSQGFLLLDDKDQLRVDLVLRFERLADDWEMLARLVQLRAGVDLARLPRRRTSEHDQVDEYYDDHTRALIRQRYATDFGALHYEAPPARLRREPVDTKLEAVLAEHNGGLNVLDMTPATISRARTVGRSSGSYLAPARHNRIGQLARFTALQTGRVPPEVFDVLVIDSGAAEEREPHRSLVEQFRAAGRTVVLA